MSDNLKAVERMYRDEFVSGSGSAKKKKHGEGQGINIFHGNLHQYNEKAKEAPPSRADLKK